MTMERSDLLSLETRVRDYIGEETAKFWTQASMFRAINDEVSRLARKVVELDQGWFEITETATLSSATINLPATAYIIRSVNVYKNSYWLPLQWNNQHNRYIFQAGTNTTQAIAVRFEGRSIILESGIADATQYRIVYVKMPADMRYEAVASTTSTSVFTIGSTASIWDDAYNGDRIAILSGTGVRQNGVVSDYVGTTKVVTLVTALTTALDTTSYYSTILPDPLWRFPDLVALGAAIRLLVRRRDVESISVLRDQYNNDLADMLAELSRRQTDTAERINYIPHEQDLFD